MAAANGTAARIIEIAEGEIGYLEKKTNAYLDHKTKNAGYNNYTKYNRDCGFGNGPDWYWCNAFVSWCAMKAGVPTSVIPKTASCRTTGDFFKARNRLYTPASGYKPVAGDLMLFTTSRHPGPGHIGIVYKCDGKTVYTIEGNTSGGSEVISNGGGVCKKSYSLTKSSIYGYCHPNYAVETKVEEDDEVVKTLQVVDKQTGSLVTVSAIEKDGLNYIKMRDLEKFDHAEVSYDVEKKVPQIDLGRTMRSIRVKMDGKIVSVDAVNQKDYNYVGIRNLFEQLGYTVGWDDTTQTVLIEK